MVGGLIDWLLSDGSETMAEALRAYRGPCNVAELKFRDALAEHLAGTLDGCTLKRECGVTGTGTRVDLYAHHGGTDHVITIKRGLSEQKVKIVIGEITQVLMHWEPREPGRKVFVWFVFYASDGHELDKHYVDFFPPFERFMDTTNFRNKKFAVKAIPLLPDESEEENHEGKADAATKDSADAPSMAPQPSRAKTARFRDEMLGDEHRGLSAGEIAVLLDLKEATVRSYLSQIRRKMELGERIRANPALRMKALMIVQAKRDVVK